MVFNCLRITQRSLIPLLMVLFVMLLAAGTRSCAGSVFADARYSTNAEEAGSA